MGDVTATTLNSIELGEAPAPIFMSDLRKEEDVDIFTTLIHVHTCIFIARPFLHLHRNTLLQLSTTILAPFILVHSL